MNDIVNNNTYKVSSGYATSKVVDINLRRDEKLAINKYSKLTSIDTGTYSDVEKLETYYASTAASNRAKYSNNTELYNHLYNKYFNESSEEYAGAGYSKEEIVAMYNNEKNMTLYGSLRYDASFEDPVLKDEAAVDDAVVTAQKEHSKDSVSKQIDNVLKFNGVNLDKNEFVLFSIEPIDFKLSATGLENPPKVSMLIDALNFENNAEELFYYLLHSGFPVPEDVMAKFEAAREIKNATGENLNNLKFEDGSYFTESGEDVAELYKSSIEKTDLPEELKSQAYEEFMGNLDTVTQKGRDNIPDLTMVAGYRNSKIVSMNVNYEV